MRISTLTIFNQSVGSLNQQQAKFNDVSQQIASGRRVTSPSDDPQAAARAVGVSQSLAITEQYTDSRVSARTALEQSESVLNSVSDSITSAKTLLIQGANDTLSEADRQSVAYELRGVYNTLLGQANAADGNGNYLFGGYKDDEAPFVQGGGTVTYEGDDKVREQRIDASRLMPVGASGGDIFGADGDDAALFTTLESAIGKLESGSGDLGAEMDSLDDHLDTVLTVRASMGARLNELDVVDGVAANRTLNYEQTRSDLVDLDYVEAISEYSLRQVGLQASQQTFANMKGMSLFQYL
ncbi:flagellar hook-associated protein FlgL [Halomonas salina]|uniref:Flagellar hook-associated protein 3 n=1 Tax=Halomonas salina TaxID=42565 RepID=A0ABR4WUW0_9GAMM|nr:flagellar hook-associated protein FlgL [Halomonas salina]KGE78528.1 hypothetical protein FP66_01995 [Halomonas salina]